MYNKLINFIEFNNKWNLLFIVIWVILYNYGYITENRVIIFSIVIIWICVYKILYKKVKEKDIIYNEKFLYILLWIDYLKLCIINTLIFIRIKLYDLKIIDESNFMIKLCILIFENLTVNPLQMILYKFYNVLYNWNITPILEIFFKRIYGSVLGILIFSNIISYVWYLLNYSILNVYLVLLLINVIDEISKTKKYDEYSLFYYIKYLNLNKDIFEIIEYRSFTSIFSLYIQKALKSYNIDYHSNKIKSFAFTLNNIYYFKQYENLNLNIYNYKIQLNSNKFYKSKSLFKSFYFDIVLCLNGYFRLLATLEYVLIKITSNKNILINVSINDLLKLKEFILLVIKFLLYYLWDFENLNKDVINFDFSKLIINEISTIYELEYEYIWVNDATLLSKIKNCKINNIRIFNIQQNQKFYEQFYLYAKMISNYDLNNNKIISSVIIDFAQYTNIEDYSIKILNKLLIINAIYGIDIEFCRANETNETIELEILKRLNEYKKVFIEEWKNSLNKDLEIRNYQRLKDLNEYIERNVKL